jgi:hypothetical protein
MARNFTLLSRRSGAVQLRVAADHTIFDLAQECDSEHRTTEDSDADGNLQTERLLRRHMREVPAGLVALPMLVACGGQQILASACYAAGTVPVAGTTALARPIRTPNTT